MKPECGRVSMKLSRLQGAGALDWSRACVDRLGSGGRGRGEKPAPIPRRRKPGSKHHVIQANVGSNDLT